MSSPFIIFLTAIVCGTQHALSTDICDPETKLQCEGKLQTYVAEETPFLTEEMLENHCDDIISNIKCMEDIARECQQKELIGYILIGPSLRNILGDLCTEDSKLRIAYREHVSCINSLNVRNGIVACLEPVGNSIVNRVEDVRKNDKSMQEVIDFTCSSYDPLKVCLRKSVTENCKEEAAIFFEDIVDQITEVPRLLICSVSMTSIKDKDGKDIGSDQDLYNKDDDDGSDSNELW